MKNLLIIFFFLVCAGTLYAQKGQRIENAKIAFLTDRLNLTTDQAQKFWPVYNEYDDKKKAIRKGMKELRTEGLNFTATDEELLADLRKFMALKQQETDVEKEYFEKFQKVISVRQLVEFYRAEKQFAMELIKRMDEKKGHN
jgi:hypothetical protein